MEVCFFITDINDYLTRLFGDKFDLEFWRMVQYANQESRQDKLKLVHLQCPLYLPVTF